jgi:dTDP-glucose 4,6-dehydratase
MNPDDSPSHGFEPKSLLVTGGAGFIGSNFIRWALKRDPRVRTVNLDSLTYAGNLEGLSDVNGGFGPTGDKRYAFVHGDIRNQNLVGDLLSSKHPATSEDRPDAIVHFAAEPHVDRSFLGPGVFIEMNILGTYSLLEATRVELSQNAHPFRFVHVSTDEVNGSLDSGDPAFSETTPLAPNSPYSASKASSDLLARLHIHTFGLLCITTRCSNNYGPYQFPEKLIPLMITRALADQRLPIYGDDLNVRDWLHVVDHAEAIWEVLVCGRIGEVYNIGGESEVTNNRIVRHVLDLLGKSESLITYVTDRAGHDRRYAMDIGKIKRELGWMPRRSLEDGIRTTVDWYLSDRPWWERVLNEAYQTASSIYLDESRCQPQ